MADDAEQSDHRLGKVFPPDNRTRIDPTTVSPYFWIGELAITFPNGDSGTGTGTLIDRFHVLTCGHNLYQKARGGKATSVTFSPARNGNIFPSPSIGFDALNVSEEYIALSPADPKGGIVDDYTQYLYDYGVMTLQKGIDPAQGLFPPLYNASDDALNGRIADIGGYPGDKPEGTMWNGRGSLAKPSDEFLFYKISTYAGQSGSAVRCLFGEAEDNGVPRIVGLHVAGSVKIGSNFAVRLNNDVTTQIEEWL